MNPSFKVQSRIINVLRENEYEIYIIQRWRDVKNYLSKNPDSICLMNVDSQIPIASWIAMVYTFSKERVLNTIVCGFLTEGAAKNAAKVLDVIKLGAGFNTTSGDETHVTNVLKNIFDVLGAKGRRQHVRCSCFKENAFVYVTLHDSGGNPTMLQMKIVDISSATVAVEVPEVLRGKLKIGTLFQSVIITLNGRQLNTGLKVFLLKKTEKQTEIAIFSYPSNLPAESKAYIRNFISDTLQKEMDRCINGMKEDKTDYNMEAASMQLVQNAKDAGVNVDAANKAPASEQADSSDTDEKPAEESAQSNADEAAQSNAGGGTEDGA